MGIGRRRAQRNASAAGPQHHHHPPKKHTNTPRTQHSSGVHVAVWHVVKLGLLICTREAAAQVVKEEQSGAVRCGACVFGDDQVCLLPAHGNCP